MSEKQIEQTYYEILEVSADCGHHEIVSAYERAKAAYSPDSPALYTMFTAEEAEELRKLIEEAFLILGNQAKRREYDLVLKARMRQPTADDLPDFMPQAPTPVKSEMTKAETTSQAAAQANAAGNKTVPAGFAKSRLSIYEVNEQFEAELAATTDFSGETIKKIRQYKNINLDQLSKETRISRSYLAALEANDYDALPAPVFSRGFIVQVARTLNIDENIVANSYMSKFKKGK